MSPPHAPARTHFRAFNGPVSLKQWLCALGISALQNFRAFNGPVSLKHLILDEFAFHEHNFRAFNGPVSLKPVLNDLASGSVEISGPSTARSH